MRKFFILLSFCFTAVAFANGGPDFRTLLQSDKSDDEKISGVGALVSQAGSKQVDHVMKANKGKIIVDLCRSKFASPGQEDSAFALYDPKTKQGHYFAVVGKKVLRVGEAPLKDKANPLANIEVQCRDAEEMQNWVKDLSEADAAVDHAGFKLINQKLGSICLQPVGEFRGQTFVCYQYDAKKKSFTGVGGWGG